MIANQLAFQLGFQLLRQLSSFCLRTIMLDCIKEDEIDCVWLAVLYVKKNETVRKVEERMRGRRLSIREE
jgi:hypothetical protein